MRVAFVHYHLRPGGVATVIRRQAEALRGAADTLLLTGEPPGQPFPGPVVHVPALAYDLRRDPHWSAEGLAEAMRRAVLDHWPAGCDLFHVHNPTLAKNRLLLDALRRLGDRGQRLLLQIHDFAEDGRPEVYPRDPYPADCHYAVLNRRDLDLLGRAGLRTEGLHLLPNQVQPPAPPAPRTAWADHILYPVRAIRRKNIGEALLWSCFLPPGTVLAVTLGPHSPADQGPYRFWQALAGRHRLAVRFEAGRRGDFTRLVQTARFLITTSVNEGFGFAFAEPWPSGKLLWGRRLAVCDDFAADGLRLDHLYPALQVPTQWLDLGYWRRVWMQAWTHSRTAFGRPPDRQPAQARFQSLAQARTVDLGLLDERLQAEVVVRCRHSPADRSALVRLNPFLARAGEVPDRRALIRDNAAAVARSYGLEADRRRLLAAYRRSCRAVVQRIDRRQLLDGFLDSCAFSLLRWGTWID
jgi:hypothetical protein